MKMVIVMRTDLNMRKGKMAAQAAHAAVTTVQWIDKYGTKVQQSKKAQWLAEGQRKIVVGTASLEDLDALTVKALTADLNFEVITDRGDTEFHGVPTVTCVALGPDEDENLDPITGDLRLL